ncbi:MULTISPECIES: M20/M25/M40 family metallo-hydrolase [Citricoccus]|uniref:M20/M25/M40 family metallo-hydrolase n=1 Tax=Citricoccus TaxID=169133 RepID=UPI000255F037|nr:M20/M25/M40 family metallo-hydrolase [Citricoccus sp. CH26A]
MALVAAGAIALLMTVIVVAVNAASEAGRKAAVSPVYAHLEQFQALAEEHGDRAAGTDGYEAAAQYVEEQLERAGLESTRHYFTFYDDDEEMESFSIIAETAEGSAEDVIMLGAHLDGVPGSPAISDNATGSAALLEAASALGTQDEIKHKVRFAWWGAEEYRRAPGSRAYVEDLDDEDELENIKAYLNFDMVASPNPVIGVYDAKDDDASQDIPEGSVKVMKFFTDYFDSRGQPWVATGWDMSSDQRSFTREDVPVGGLFTGSDERKSRKDVRIFGGVAKAPRDPNYHTPNDDISNIDMDALDIMTDAVTHAATELAQDRSALKISSVDSTEDSGTAE